MMGIRLTTEEFIQRSKEVHGNKYDYTKVIYINAFIKVIIICPIHGEFLQKPYKHLNSKHGCWKCSGCEPSTTDFFIKKAEETHGNKYYYSKVVYINNKTPIIIICPIHGEFLQRPDSHLRGLGCLACSGLKKLTTLEFINKSKKIHGNKYDYSKVVYINIKAPVIIICQNHGEFLQTPSDHLYCKAGCPKCKLSKGEILIAKILKKLNITYERQKRFNSCISSITKRKLKYDFYLPNENILIEYNGEQHYRTVKYWHKHNNSFKNQQDRDFLKQQYAINNGYKFLVIKYNEDIVEKLKKVLNL